MINNTERNGNFTSSKAGVLMSPGKKKGEFSAKALTYIEQRKKERKLGRSLSLNKQNRATLWGHCLEGYVLQKLNETDDFNGYELTANDSVIHPKYSFWAGSPDLRHRAKVGDIKCYEPENFVNIVDAMLTGDIQVFKKECPDEYWQLVSNACILNVPNAEIIAFMPYESELFDLMNYVDNLDIDQPWRYKFISDAITNDDYSELPYLPDGGYYKNLNRFEFVVPGEDKLILEEWIIKANNSISDDSHIITATYDRDLKATIIE